MALEIDDPVLMIRAMGELLTTVLSMHMSPEKLMSTAAGLRAIADGQEQAEAAGVAIHPSNRAHDPALARAIADFYDLAHRNSVARFTGVTQPNPGHRHAYKDGSATPPAA